ncbi:MAG: site-specific DNA-methyltransferase [Promethearchaeia archaeon]
MFNIEEPIIYYKSSEKMGEIEDSSIQLIITSPPYGQIKNYGSKDQIGFFDSFEDYFERLNNVWTESFRVLEPQCRMVINVGDQYLRTKDYGRYRIISIQSKIIEDCQKIGFDFLGDIIWQKVSTTNTTGGCSLMGSIYYPRNGLLTYDYEHILIFKKPHGKGRKVDFKIKEMSKISLSEWKKWFIGHWKFPGVIQKEHIAMFPEELPYRLIRMFTFIGDIVLDPFVGSGTTLKVAKSLFRKSIGYEINEYFQPTIKNKIKEAQIGYFKDFQYLLYTLFRRLRQENFDIIYQEQKQKGIIALENKNKKRIILDYLLIQNNDLIKQEIEKEIKAKLEENTVQNYLKEKLDWKTFSNYIIVINSKLKSFSKIKDCFDNCLKSYKSKKDVRIILFEDIISDNFEFKTLFI